MLFQTPLQQGQYARQQGCRAILLQYCPEILDFIFLLMYNEDSNIKKYRVVTKYHQN